MARVERRAEVVWEGGLTDGRGAVSAGSGAVSDLPVTWASRVERAEGTTSPEELIAEAHAACYAMSLSATLDEAGKPPERLAVNAVVGAEHGDEGLEVTTSEVEVVARVPGLEPEELQRLAEEAERACPVSNALRRSLKIRVRATLDG